MNYKLHGTRTMAESIDKSRETLKRWMKTPEGAFIEVGSCDHGITEYGRAAWSYMSSLQALKATMTARTSEARRQAANRRWRTDCSSGGVW